MFFQENILKYQRKKKKTGFRVLGFLSIIQIEDSIRTVWVTEPDWPVYNLADFTLLLSSQFSAQYNSQIFYEVFQLG